MNTIIVTAAAAVASFMLTTMGAQAQTAPGDDVTPAWCAVHANSLSTALDDNGEDDNKAMIDLIYKKDRTPADDAEVEHLRDLSGYGMKYAEDLLDRYPDARFDKEAYTAFAAMNHDALLDKAEACLAGND